MTCWLHSIFINMKLKATTYFFFFLKVANFADQPPPLRKNRFARINWLDHFRCKKIFNYLSADKLKSDNWCFTWSLYSCKVSYEQNRARSFKWYMFHALDLSCRFTNFFPPIQCVTQCIIDSKFADLNTTAQWFSLSLSVSLFLSPSLPLSLSKYIDYFRVTLSDLHN